MWFYHQKTGRMFEDLAPVGRGYSGRGEGLNSPEAQQTPFVGPVPRGVYKMQETDDGKPIFLTPAPTNATYGRCTFCLCAADWPETDGTDACIVFPEQLLRRLYAGGNRTLVVTE